MVTDLQFLWRNRSKPCQFWHWAKVWLKRVYHLRGLLRLLMRATFFRIRGASIGHLTILGEAKVVGPVHNLVIGCESALGQCEIHLHAMVSIGNRVVISDGAVLLTASHSVSDPSWGRKVSPIVIRDYAWIASNAICLPGVTIGTGAVVGAGAVVRSDVADYAVVVGNPADLIPSGRSQILDYSPVMFNAPFEAWVGPHHLKNFGSA